MDRLLDLIISDAHSERDRAPAVPVNDGCDDDQGLELAMFSVCCTQMLTTPVAER